MNDLREHHEDPGPLRAYLYRQANLIKPGVIAYLLWIKNAELCRIGDNLSFSASFILKIVLLIRATDHLVPIFKGGG
jgi:hypothetical protein